MMRKERLYSRAVKLAAPMIIQNGITNMVTLVDNMMVGTLGTEAITGVSVVGQLFFVFNLAVFGGLSGPGLFGAQYYGQGNEEGFRITVRIKHWIGAACLLVGGLILLFGKEFLIGLYLNGESGSVDPALTMHYARRYMEIMLLGLPPFVLTQIYATSLRETGKSVMPMIAGLSSVVVDVVFNYILIYGKFGFPRLGVEGAAIATVMARVVETVIVIAGVFTSRKGHAFFRGLYRTLLVPGALAFRIVKKGIPIFFNEFLWAGAMAGLTQCFSVRGLEIVAGLNISNAICNLFNVLFVSLGSAVGILVGQMLGAGQYVEAKKSAFRLMWFTGGACLILTAVLIVLSGFFPKFYETTQQVRQYAQWFIIITALFFPLQGFLNALYFTLRSGGKTFITFLFDAGYSWAVVLSTATLLCRFTALPILVVFAIVQSLDITKVIIGSVLVQKGIWISNLVEN